MVTPIPLKSEMLLEFVAGIDQGVVQAQETCQIQTNHVNKTYSTLGFLIEVQGQINVQVLNSKVFLHTLLLTVMQSLINVKSGIVDPKINKRAAPLLGTPEYSIKGKKNPFPLVQTRKSLPIFRYISTLQNYKDSAFMIPQLF